MSGQHTKGRLEAQANGSDSQFDINTKDGMTVATASKANARRLAACWNACEGLTQDHFDGGWTALGLSKYAKLLEGELAAARLLLIDVMDDIPADYSDDLTDRIRAFLAANPL